MIICSNIIRLSSYGFELLHRELYNYIVMCKDNYKYNIVHKDMV